MHNYYLLLEISPTDDEEIIRQALHKQFRIWNHRINSPNFEKRIEAERRLRLLEEAQTILLDKQKRQEYNLRIFSLSTGEKIKEDEKKDEIIEKTEQVREQEPLNEGEALVQAAESGDVEAMYTLGCRLFEETEHEQNRFDGLQWLIQAANKGHALAMYRLSRCFYQGEMFLPNAQEGERWLRQAAEQNVVEAMAELGERLLHGREIKKNPSEAIQWLTKAAKQGHAEAQKWLEQHESTQPKKEQPEKTKEKVILDLVSESMKSTLNIQHFAIFLALLVGVEIVDYLTFDLTYWIDWGRDMLYRWSPYLAAYLLARQNYWGFLFSILAGIMKIILVSYYFFDLYHDVVPLLRDISLIMISLYGWFFWFRSSYKGKKSLSTKVTILIVVIYLAIGICYFLVKDMATEYRGLLFDGLEMGITLGMFLLIRRSAHGWPVFIAYYIISMILDITNEEDLNVYDIPRIMSDCSMIIVSIYGYFQWKKNAVQ
ncbi:nicotinamide mononucleotide transporter [Thermoflavimicrobium dichotomicum]|uniref:Sel1 repeat-containing protein n=1 Tax=Thermoflavimicrobium dichotomicum TaxID=46223 RepID=A0A1I3RUI4_9BACL|nr:nicotinamide mononucleotide transporter [Thermoflavimicrobium dichotomicum]SFJ49169.1 Sel1 repeat-containing protein [Thermoflavimicrobium dichotomicum]